MPGWLSQAADFDLVAIEEGSTVLVMEAPILADAAPDQFRQQSLFHPISPEDSAVDLMRQSLTEAIAGRTDSELLDQGLLAVFHRFRESLSFGFSSIELTNGQDSSLPVEIDLAAVESVERLRVSTPPPQRARVAGTLDTIRHSDRMFTLLLDEGSSVKGIAEGVAAGQLASLFGTMVVVSGTAVFRPSGRLLRLEAESIELAEGTVEIWSHLPVPVFQVMETAELRQPQGPRSGVNAIIGQWPGDESDDELASAIAELS